MHSYDPCRLVQILQEPPISISISLFTVAFVGCLRGSEEVLFGARVSVSFCESVWFWWSFGVRSGRSRAHVVCVQNVLCSLLPASMMRLDHANLRLGVRG